MERTTHRYDPLGEDERLLCSARAPDTARIFATADGIRNRKWAHGLWMASCALSSVIVFFAFVSPSIMIPVSAQAVTDGRMVRQEERLEAITTTQAQHSAKMEIMMEHITRLEGVVEGDEKTIKFGGSAVVILNVLAAWLSRKQK